MGVLVGGAVGVVTVRPGSTSEPIQTIPISPNTGELADALTTMGSVLIPGDGTTTTIDLLGITTVSFMHLKCTDSVSGADASIEYNLTGNEQGGLFKLEGAEILYSTPENADITGLSITGQVSGNDLKVDYTLVGV